MSNTANIESTYTCGHGKFAKLTSLNYTQWAADVTAVLIAEDALEIVQGNEPAPPTTQRTTAADYRRRKGKAYATLFMSCTPGMQNLIQGVTDPATIWNTLKEKHDSVESRARRAVLARQFYSRLPQTDEKMTDFIAALQSSRALLAGTEQAISDEAFCSHLMRVVPARFHQAIDILLDRERGYNPDDLIGKILEHEAILADREIAASSSNQSGTSGTALAAGAAEKYRRGGKRNKRNSYGGFNKHSGGSDSTKKPQHADKDCYYCGRHGHIQADCRTKKAGEERRKRNP